MKKIHYTSIAIIFISILYNPCLKAWEHREPDAVYKDYQVEIRLNEDGTWVERHAFELKLQSYYAFHRSFGETFITYNPAFEEVKINHAYTIMADGKRIETPDNAFNEVLPRLAKDCPPYSHLRELVVTHTGLENDAVIFLDYEIKRTNPFSGLLHLAKKAPVAECRVSITIPQSIDLHYRIVNTEGEAGIENANGTKSYQWKFNHLPEMHHEDHEPAMGSGEPLILFSNYAGSSQMLQSMAGGDAFVMLETGIMRSFVDKVRKDTDSDFQLAIKLQEHVINNINFYPVPLKYTGLQPRSTSVVWEANGGTALEKTLVLAALYKAAGIKATLCAVYPEAIYDAGVGVTDAIEDFILRVQIPKVGDIYMSAIHKHDNDLGFSLAGKSILSLQMENAGTLIENNIELRPGMLRFLLEIEKNTITGSVDVLLEGALLPYFDLMDKGNEYRSFFTDKAWNNAITDVVINYLEKDKVTLKIYFERKDHGQRYGNTSIFDLPRMKAGWYDFITVNRRDKPLVFPAPVTLSSDFNIKVHKSLRAGFSGENMELQNEHGFYKRNIEEIDESIILYQVASFSALYPVTAYHDYVKVANEWNDPNNWKLVITY